MNKDEKKKVKESGVRLTAYVPVGIKRQVELLAFSRTTTSSTIVTEALTAFLTNKKNLVNLQDLSNEFS